jgi:hypothetical protein
LLMGNLHKGTRVRFLIASCAISLYLSNGMLQYWELAPENPPLPRWSDEVQLWRNDPRHGLRVWPSFWTSTVSLSSLGTGPPIVAQPVPVEARPSSGAGSSGKFR